MSDKDQELFQRLRKTHSVLLTGEDPEQKRREILQYFHATWELEDKLYTTLRDDSCFYAYATPLRHPLIFYLAHTACFFVNKLMLAKLITKRVNPRIESVSAVGVDENSYDRDLGQDLDDWPTVDEVRQYRHTVRSLVHDLLSTLPLKKLPIDWDHDWWVFMMCIEHARIHIETSSVLIRQLPIECVHPMPFFNRCAEMITGDPHSEEVNALVPKNALIVVSGGKISFGRPFNDALYGWDVDYGHAEEDVHDFTASRYLCSNHEFLEFVEDGGYGNKKWWTEEGWNWREFSKTTAPTFWVRTSADEGSNQKNDRWIYRAMLEIIDMPWDWPVEVNHLEAKAFCNWKAHKLGKKGIRLLTEAEWYVLRKNNMSAPMNEQDLGQWSSAPGNINLEYWCSSCPVNKFQQSDDGMCDIVGNVWQWTDTPVDAYKGYRTHRLYDDFSLPTFDLRHNMIKGGSWISTGNEATTFARYAFRRHFFQHAGLRYICSDEDVKIRTDVYENAESAGQYIDNHFGKTVHLGVAPFPAICAQLCLSLADRHLRTRDGKNRALDLGCSVGRAAFELAREFNNVVGLDLSANFIRVVDKLKQGDMYRYHVVGEGDLKISQSCTLADFELQHVAHKVQFFQADACNMDQKYSNYDLVLAANLIDRLYSPETFLRLIHERINDGGLLVLASPYTWLTDHTPKDQWLGGYIDSKTGEEVYALDTIKRILSDHFEQVSEPVDVPTVIRDHPRKFQYIASQLTCWRKKNHSPHEVL